MKVWRHIKKGGLYFVIGKVRLKHPATRQWEDAVLYHPLDRPGDQYVRLQAEWDAKFEVVDV